MAYQRMTTLIRIGDEPGSAFIGRCEDGQVRLGYRGLVSVDGTYPEWSALADRAIYMDDDEFEDAISEAFRIRGVTRKAA